MTTPKEERLRRKAEEAAKELVRRKPPEGKVPVDYGSLAPNRALTTRRLWPPIPDFMVRGWYEDQPFTCVDCGAVEVWLASQQKSWFEAAKGNIFSCAIRCRVCREKERLRRDEARRAYYEGLLRKHRRLERLRPRPAPISSDSPPMEAAQIETSAPRGKGNALRRRKLGRRPPPDRLREEGATD